MHATLLWIAALCSASTAAPGDAPTTVVVMPLEARGGVSGDLAAQATAWLVSHAARLPGYKITAFSEVQGALGVEQFRQLAGCDTATCAAEIAGALNSDELVLGNLGRVGNAYVLTLSRVRARDAAVAGRSARRLTVTEDTAILDAMPGVVAELFGTAPQSDPAASSILPTILRGTSLVGAGATAVLLGTTLAMAGGGAGITAYDLAQTGFQPREHVVPVWLGLTANVLGGAAAAGLLVVILGGTAAAALLAASFLVGGAP